MEEDVQEPEALSALRAMLKDARKLLEACLRALETGRLPQNHYNVARREDDDLVDSLAAQGIAYVPFWPLGGFSSLQSETLDVVAARLEATPMAVALAWLLQRSSNILLIPGTSSVAHLRENVAGTGTTLPQDALAELDGIAS